MKWMVCFLCIFSGLDASVFLYNNTDFRMTAVVVAANGKQMGQKTVMPEQTGYVEDYIGQSDPVGKSQTPEGNSTYSLTPYTVFWYCESGALYSTCEGVAAGALAAPNFGQGPMYCPKEQQPKNQPHDTYAPGSP